MMHKDDSPERAPLLFELRGDTDVNPSALARVRERVAVSLTAAHLTAIGASIHGIEQPLRLRGARVGRASWSGLLIALGVGTALGAGGHALVSSQTEVGEHGEPVVGRPAPRRAAAPVAPPTAVTLPLEPLISGSTEPAPAAPVVRAPGAGSTTPAAKSSATDDSLGRELRELDQARRAIASGQPSRALALLESHAQLHPSSMLSQERDALTVKALVGAGRHVEARAAGQRFRAKYPDGLLLDAVSAALATIP
jgi:hypothetical protein